MSLESRSGMEASGAKRRENNSSRLAAAGWGVVFAATSRPKARARPSRQEALQSCGIAGVKASQGQIDFLGERTHGMTVPVPDWVVNGLG
jgi:hypothetical protein